MNKVGRIVFFGEDSRLPTELAWKIIGAMPPDGMMERWKKKVIAYSSNARMIGKTKEEFFEEVFGSGYGELWGVRRGRLIVRTREDRS